MSMPAHLAPLINLLWKKGAIKVDLVNGFKLAFHEDHPDAPLSPFYVSLRTKENPKPGVLGPDEIGRVALALDILRAQMGISPTWICGIPNAGLEFGRALSRIRQIQHLELLKTMADERRGFTFQDGPRPGPDDTVLLVDDLISDAKVKRLALQLLASTGAKVSLVVLMDREQGGMQALLEDGYEVGAAFTLTEFLAESTTIGALKPNELVAIQAYPAVLAAYKAEHNVR